MYCNI